MKKKMLFLPILSAMMLTSCALPFGTNNSTQSNNNSTNESSIPAEETKLIITELVEGSGDSTTVYNNAIEIYNFSDEDVNLADYSIAHYQREITPSNIVKLEGTLKAKETYVVVTGTADNEELKAKANLISNDLFFTGKGMVALLLNDNIVDCLGYPTIYSDYAASVTLVRKVNFMEPRLEYDAYDWIRYSADNYKYLGNVENSVTPEELLNGPVLEDKYFDHNQYPFYYNDGNSIRGGGGAVSGSVKNNIDGDTSDLFVNGLTPSEFMAENKYYGVVGGKTWIRCRYYAVDTPESGGNAGIQEFGMMAKYYTAYIQNKADTIYVQTVSGDSIVGNFGRLLAYIWADKDTMVNYETIKAGYSKAQYDFHEDMMYKDLPYEAYFYNANLHAMKFKLGRYGEKDPYWNYSSNSSYCEKIVCGNYFENDGSILG